MAYASKNPGRIAWEDRFHEPSVAELRSHYSKQMAGLLEAAREQLRSYDGMSENIAWHGLPWRWTLTYSQPEDEERAWAYLIPDPESPRLAMPLTADQIRVLPMKRLKKHVREGIERAKRVAGVWWATWSFSSKRELEDVMDVVKRRHKHMAAA